MLAEEGEYRPGKVPLCAYTTPIGITANEAAENVARLMDLAIERYGRPTEKPFYATTRFCQKYEVMANELISMFMRLTDWDQTPWRERTVS